MASAEKKKGGWLYFLEATLKNGKKKIYTGITRRNPKKRWGEHIRGVKSKSTRTWTSRAKFIRPLGALWSANPEKAERTAKKLSPAKKRYLARKGAGRYKRKKALYILDNL